MRAQEKEDLAEERQLVEAAQSGDVRALRRLLSRISPLVYRTVILPRARCRADADEILQDTLSTGTLKLATFRWRRRGVVPWFQKIALNKLRDRYRKEARHTRLVEEVALEPSATAAGADAPLLQEQEASERKEKVLGTLGALRPRYQEAIRLRLQEGLSRADCASKMGLEVGTFDVLLYRAVRAFRAAYGQDGHE